WENIDLGTGKDAGTITVERSFDPKTGTYVAPKSRAGTRRVPIATVLRERLVEHRLRTGRASGLVFGPDGGRPLSYSRTPDRARRAWANTCTCGHTVENHNGEGGCDQFQALEPIGLHEARHTFASLMIAAHVNVKALSTYMGHAGISITLDRYGHLLPGNEQE